MMTGIVPSPQSSLTTPTSSDIFVMSPRSIVTDEEERRLVEWPQGSPSPLWLAAVYPFLKREGEEEGGGEGSENGSE